MWGKMGRVSSITWVLLDLPSALIDNINSIERIGVILYNYVNITFVGPLTS